MGEKAPVKVRSMVGAPVLATAAAPPASDNAPAPPGFSRPRTIGSAPPVMPRRLMQDKMPAVSNRQSAQVPTIPVIPTLPAEPLAAAPAMPPSSPRTMPGQVRMGLKVEAQTLARAFAQYEEKHRLAASRIIGSIAIAHLGWNEAQKLGFTAQNQYGALVQALLEAATMDVIRKAPVQLSRLLHILELCAQDFSRPASSVGQWLKKKDKPQQFDIYRDEIDQLRLTLQAQMFDVEQPMDRVMAALGKINALFDDLVAHSIAAEWLADHNEIPEAARSALLDRSRALTKTAALVKAQQSQSLMTVNQLDALRDRIQEAVLIALPSWLAQLASLPASLNESQRFVIRDDLLQIISRLKT